MVYPAPFLRLVAIGTLYGAEDFTFSMSLIEDGVGPFVPPTEVPADVLTALTTFFTGSGLIQAGAQLTAVKLNEIGTDGRYTQPQTVLHEFVPPIAGNSTTNPRPPQVALAVTLDTDARRGLAHAGRFFLPLPAGNISTDGRLSTASQSDYLTAARTLLDDINDAVPGYLVGITSNVGAGEQRYVRQVRVGRAVDTVRSRRTSIPEDYQDLPLLTIFP